VPRITTAILILSVGAYLARWVSRVIVGAFARASHLDPTTRPIIGEVARYTVLVLSLVAALTQIGIQTASLFAVLGAAGLAIGLALQGTLANIASGIMLLWLRPFRDGDYIEVASGAAISGTVEEIGLFSCLLRTHDGIRIFAPNSAIWNSALRNYSQNAGRLVSYKIRVPDEADSNKTKQALLDFAKANIDVLDDPAPAVFADDLNKEGLLLTLRAWVRHDAITDFQHSALDEIRARLTALGNQFRPREISRVVPGECDPSRVPLSASR
jgi:small conductance mechanosensitive channel